MTLATARDLRRAARACAVSLLAACVIACSRSDAGATAAALADQSAQPSAQAADETLLDRRSDGAALYGRVASAPVDTDLPRVLVLRTTLGGAPLDASLDGARVLDARFAGSAVVTIGDDRVLRVHERGVATALDTDAEAPLSVEGHVVAYARGAMPSFELARADLATGVAQQWTVDMAPVWSPALSADGREVVFVSGVSGTARLYRLGANGAPVALAATASFPSSLRAPRWHDSTLTFEDELGAQHELPL